MKMIEPRLSLQLWVFGCARDPLDHLVDWIADAPKQPRLESEPS